MENYKIVHRGGQGEIVEKKSRFIATVCPVMSEEEAISFIEKTNSVDKSKTFTVFINELFK